MQEKVPQRRSEELARTSSRPIRRESTVPHGSPFEMQQSSLPGQGFAANLQELMPLDVNLAGTSPESAGTPGGVHGHSQGFAQGGIPGSAGPLYKLDAIMFSSGDPFAYPNQPMMDASSYHRAGSHAGGSQGADAQFYMPSGVYDDIEGQLLGPIPPYLVPGAQGHHALDPASQMYNTPSMLTMQQDHGQRQRQQQQQQRQRQQQAQQAQQRRHQQQMAQQQQDLIDDVMVDPSFSQGEWDDMLNNQGFR